MLKSNENSIMDNSLKENSYLLKINGTIDHETTNELDSFLHNIDSNTELSIDFSKVDYISFSAIKILLKSQCHFNHRFKLINVSDANMQILSFFKDNFCFSKSENYYYNEKIINFESKNENRYFDLFEGIDKTKEVLMNYDEKDYSYSDIVKATNHICEALKEKGLKKNDVVIIDSLDSFNQVACLFGINKLGAVAAIVNPSFNSKEINSIAKMVNAKGICIGNIENPLLEDIYNNITINNKIDISDEINFLSEDDYEVINSPFIYPVDELAVIIFTSGSTNAPKPLMHSYYSLINTAIHAMPVSVLNKGDRAVFISPLFHMMGLMGLFSSIINRTVSCIGNMLGVHKLNVRIEKYANTIFTNKCKSLWTVPTILTLLLNSNEFDDGKLSTLKQMVIGGQIVGKHLYKEVREKLPDVSFSVSYGMSELAPISCVECKDIESFKEGNVGVPEKETSVKIVNPDNLQECKPNEDGEIYVKNNVWSACYYNDSNLKESFTSDGYLKTGDIGRIDEDGYLYYSTRSKNIINRGGEKINPVEVENAFKELKYIDKVFICGVKDNVMGEEIAAAIIMKDNNKFDKESIRLDLKKYLSSSKIPRKYVELKEFPMLGSGKIDGVKLKNIINEYENIK